MIIRSQDKKVIVNLDNIDSICIEHKIGEVDVVCYNGFEDTRMGIGAYSTEEKAIKVLDMIQQEYGKHLYGQGGQMATADIYIQPFAFIPPKVFQMPSDEEVEV